MTDETDTSQYAQPEISSVESERRERPRASRIPPVGEPRITFIHCDSQEPDGLLFDRWQIDVAHSDESTRQTLSVWLDALVFHLEKAKDYQGAEQELGPKAQFVDMSRKWVKVRAAMWFGKALTGPEKLPEIIMDLMGHCGLSLKMFRWPGDKPWSDEINGGNYVWPDKPTPGS